MNEAFNKPYDPQSIEGKRYEEWEKTGGFRPAAPHLKPFSIVIPPPNVTGSLHIGHALNNTLQDILIRWRRMDGFSALWVPGTDHAGIATQNVVERQLIAEGTRREELGRDEFIKRVWKWKAESGGSIVRQLRRLGASCDWSRERFTMDEGLSVAVREAFVRLYDEGLIYRGERLINWCPRCETALSDIEVEHEEVRGKMYHIAYPLADDPQTRLTVATTRPETLLGDTAVAVHPEDSRYNRFIGRKVRLPLTDRAIPVVGDPILVDREFGTGAVKITPGHDLNDEKAGRRHRLGTISLLDRRGKMDPAGLEEALVEKAVAQSLAHQAVQEARKRVVHALEERGLLLQTEDHRHAIGKCYRCRTVVEPYLSPQWFVRVNDPQNSLAGPAIRAVEEGRIRFIPEFWQNSYFGWMREITDWCISRQIWWGHRIPAWYCRKCSEPRPIVRKESPAACPDCGSADLVQDADVLDTWFSSALWPFSTLGWPKETEDLKTFYPTAALVTSFDIIFFWVARMIMMGLKFMGEVPFRDVYIHALVRDAEGQKMSKSKGNVMDPLMIMDRYGTDALRFTLASMASPGRDIRLSEERVAGNRNFANKLWNAARFILLSVDGSRLAAYRESSAASGSLLYNRWILHRLHRVIRDVRGSLAAYRFDEAAAALYQFIWHEFCDWHLEFIKPILKSEDSAIQTETETVLLHVFNRLLRLLHPIMPFITEEIYQAFYGRPGVSLMTRPYPSEDFAPTAEDLAAEPQVEMLKAVIQGVRNLRSELTLPPSTVLTARVRLTDGRQNILIQHRETVERLARVTLSEVGPEVRRSAGSAVLLASGAEVYIPLQGIVDFDKERVRIQKLLQKIGRETAETDRKLSDESFRERAPAEVVRKEEARRADLLTQRARLEESLTWFRS
jgi:valyl-tRNA synthetase